MSGTDDLQWRDTVFRVVPFVTKEDDGGGVSSVGCEVTRDVDVGEFA